MELIAIRTFDNYINANLTLGKLRDNGIECFLEDECSSIIMTNAVVNIKLLVKDINANLAVEVLTKMDTEYLQAVICPNCEEIGLVYISKPATKNFTTILLTKIFPSFVVNPQHVYRCNNCNWESKTLPDINSNYMSEDSTSIE